MAGRAQAPGLGLMEPAQFPTLPCTLLPLPAPPGTHHFPLPDLLSEACPESVPRGGGRHGAMTNGRNEEKRGGGGRAPWSSCESRSTRCSSSSVPHRASLPTCAAKCSGPRPLPSLTAPTPPGPYSFASTCAGAWQH